MANDDIPTPTKLVGKKVAPILEMPADGVVMNESLDICAFFDTNSERFGASVLRPSTDRQDIKAWNKKLTNTLRSLTRPRCAGPPLWHSCFIFFETAASIQTSEMCKIP